MPPAHFRAGGARPIAAAVNPKSLYSSEPAPMGVGDFGLSSGTPYTYTTSQFLGQDRIIQASDSAGSGGSAFTLQLNVVLVLTHGSTTLAYWIQDVPYIDTSTRTLQAIDNIWNFSSSPTTIPTSTLSGNGTIAAYSGSDTYYYDDPGPSAGYPGDYATLSFPTNVSAKVVASVVGGLTRVGFQYNDGYGWVTFDNVSFPWTKGWTDRGFEVNGSSYNPYGTFYDAEWVAVGPGGGSSAAWSSSNQQFILEYYNGHNFESVPDAYDFGSDTAETSSGLAESLDGAGVPGAILAHGSGSLSGLYGPSNVATVNVTTAVHNGTVLVSGNATAYRGLTANVTVVPGTYTLTLMNGSTVVGTRSVSPTAGQYLSVSFAATLLLSRSNGPSGTTVAANGTLFAPGLGATVTWSGSGATLCTATVSGAGKFSCTFTVPKAKSGPYTVSAKDSASSPDTASAPFTLTTNLSVSESGSASATDVGITLTFSASASGGYAPYSSYAWAFGDGSHSSGSSASATHAFSGSGQYSVGVTVTDQVGSTANASFQVTVNADPSARTPTASPASIDLGQSTTINESAAGGSAPFTYTWSGLPSGCSGSSASVRCTPSAKGTSSITVTIKDAAGASATSSALSLTTYADPTITAPSVHPNSIDVGQSVNISATASLGSGGYSYAWSGLPTGCSGTGADLNCTPTAAGTFDPSVTVTDSNGASSSSSSTNVTVYSDPTVALPAASRASADVGQTVAFEAAPSGGSGGFSYDWSGLPSGCSGSSNPLSCTPAAAGRASVGVTVTDSNGYAVASAPLNYTVYADPVALGPMASAGSADVGQVATFSASMSGGSGVASVSWTAPSGLGCLPSAGENLSCTPTQASAPSYSISYRWTDTNGMASAASTPLDFTVYPDPTVALPNASRPSADVGQAVTFSASPALGSGGYTYLWSGLPKCGPTAGASVECNLTAPANLTVSVTVSDSNGVAAVSAPLAFEVYADPTVGTPTASRPTADVGQALTIQAVAGLGSGGYTYRWTGLPQGCSAQGPLVSCTLRAAGTFSVDVTVNDTNGLSATSGALAVTVHPDPTVRLSASRTVLDRGQPLVLTANATAGSGDLSFAWSGLPDGCTAAPSPIDCVPSESGSFNVSVRVTDSDGGTAESGVVVLDIAPTLAGAISITPTGPTAGQAARFSASSTGGTGPVEYAWAFGDGATGSGPRANHTFGSAGTYLVTLWANDSVGVSDAVTLRVNVSAPPATFLGLPALEGYALVGAVAVAALAAVAVVLARRPRRKGAPSP
jgi:hypothetical protein